MQRVPIGDIRDGREANVVVDAIMGRSFTERRKEIVVVVLGMMECGIKRGEVRVRREY